MVDSSSYMTIIKEMCDLRDLELLKKTDFVVMSYLFARLNTNNATEVKQKTIAEFTSLPKSDVSKSIKRLTDTDILIKVTDPAMPGFKLNTKFN